MSDGQPHGRHHQRADRAGRCEWTYVWEDELLACYDRAIPAGRYCAQHEIEAQTNPAARSRLTRLSARTFPSWPLPSAERIATRRPGHLAEGEQLRGGVLSDARPATTRLET